MVRVAPFFDPRCRMWANAQRDGHSAEYRWRPLFDAAKFGWRPLLECCAVTLPRRETRWNHLGCRKLTKRSQPLVSQSSPYCKDMWGRLLFNKFFRLSIRAVVAKIQPDKVVWWCPDGEFLAILGPAFPACCLQHTSDLHSKFALRPHHAWKYGRHPISDRRD